jgi:hypothetical protein
MIFIYLIAIIWVFAGLAAFIASITCLFYKGTIGEKIAGLLLGLFAGPFYWLFYIFSSNYCLN